MKIIFYNTQNNSSEHSTPSLQGLSVLGVAFLIAIMALSLNPRLVSAQANGPVPFYPLPTDTDRVTAQSVDTTSVVGGEDAAPEAWTWTVALVRADREPYDGQFCGGSLIDAQWVLTAAHCVVHNNIVLEPSELYIWANSHTLTGNEGDRVSVAQVIAHAEFDATTAANDIALLQLASPVEGSYVGLPTTAALQSLPTPSTLATVIGWGTTATQSRSDKRQQVDVPIVDNSTCATAYGSWSLGVTDSMLCAGYVDGGYDACSGDSGGPLVVPNPNAIDNDEPEWIEVGVVSWGRGCAQANAYGVYTRTASFIDWIETQMDAAVLKSPAPQTDNISDIHSEDAAIQATEAPHRTFLPVIQQ